MSKNEEKRLTFNWLNSPFSIVVCAGIFLSTFAYIYLGKQYFDFLSKRSESVHQYKSSKYKELYEQSSPKILALRKSTDELLSLLQNNYGISTFEIEKPLENLQKAIVSYDNYVFDVEFYGNSNQVTSAKEIQRWSYDVYSQFSSQLLLAEKVQDSIHDMAIGVNKISANQERKEYIRFHFDKIQNELNTMIQEENKLYYKYYKFDIPVLKLLYNQLSYNFRVSIGLNITSELAQSSEIASEIKQLEKNSKHQGSQIPYVVAQSRAVLSSDFSANDILLTKKDSRLKAELVDKLINQVVENDSYLRKERSLRRKDF
ncbi:hypothetical protein [Aliterella atlantica]|uniref:Uncharacterized protein n=1 Tax=Aliterella atlantica CENA595 TaxID=1618023 RepID=A0A0D8ZMR2_9CYAN|nr:hypothetical protein [Aliterella atlantica]KJH69637.1 hypothetical protein UH38_22665 [Aliterella atlantica CENA595]